MNSRSRALAVFLLMGVVSRVQAAQIVFKSVDATQFVSSRANLNGAINGIESGPGGWSVGEGKEKTQAAIFRTASPVNAHAFLITLFFLSGRPNSSIAEFALSATNDPEPQLGSRWLPLRIIRFSASNATLRETDGHHLRADEVPNLTTGRTKNTTYTIAVQTALDGVTAFRLEAFPVETKPENRLAMSWARDGDFVLTEFRGEIFASTNVALGAPVTATRPLWGKMSADALTDGMPATFAHPAQPETDFCFEIDLGSIYPIDHIGLRTRGDGLLPERFSRILLQLYERPPDEGAAPVWTALDRADGSHPEIGAVDTLRAADGRGVFRGRYLRISSDNPVPLSPQLAEVEVYQVRTPELVSMRADGRELSKPPFSVPALTRHLLLETKIPQFGLPPGELFRWRLRGDDLRWRPAHDFNLEIPTPPPGDYTFEAQAIHSDGTFDATVLTFPMQVFVPFVQTWTFRWLVALAAIAAGALVMSLVNRRRIALLSTETALAEERARIARDMHDDVGARLSQLAILQDAFAREHEIPEFAKEDMRQLSLTAQEVAMSLDEAVWTVNPRNDSLAAMAEYLAHYASSYLEPIEIACRIQMPVEWPDVEVHAKKRHDLVFAFKEALQNVAKHAHATEVTVALQMEDAHLIVRVADNGRGLPDLVNAPGCDGLNNMKERLARLGGSCEFNRRSAGGTEVILRIPLSK